MAHFVALDGEVSVRSILTPLLFILAQVVLKFGIAASEKRAYEANVADG